MKSIVSDVVSELEHRIGRLQSALATLRTLEPELAELNGNGKKQAIKKWVRAASPRAPWSKPKKMRITRDRMRELRKQGRYIGATRMLSAEQKAQVKATLKRQGFERAIIMANRLAAEARKTREQRAAS